jgi:hypothetical protein
MFHRLGILQMSQWLEPLLPISALDEEVFNRVGPVKIDLIEERYTQDLELKGVDEGHKVLQMLATPLKRISSSGRPSTLPTRATSMRSDFKMKCFPPYGLAKIPANFLPLSQTEMAIG